MDPDWSALIPRMSKPVHRHVYAETDSWWQCMSHWVTALVRQVWHPACHFWTCRVVLVISDQMWPSFCNPTQQVKSIRMEEVALHPPRGTVAHKLYVSIQRFIFYETSNTTRYEKRFKRNTEHTLKNGKKVFRPEDIRSQGLCGVLWLTKSTSWVYSF